MPFNSAPYLFFLIAVFLAVAAAGERARWAVLLIASYAFYAGVKVPYLIAALALVTLLTYFAALGIDKYSLRTGRKIIFWSGVSLNLLILISLKYFPAITGRGQVLIAIGVSYYVFQAISYLADVFVGTQRPERHLGYFALYISFFPKLLQGPIERAGDLLVQLKKPYVFDCENVRTGLLLFAWGLFKKVVIADRLAGFVDGVYGDVHAHAGLPLILATYIYAFQLYCDFSGYTDMALGSARLFNIQLTQNFRSPYLAQSISEFWRRWHISLSKWLLDYLFMPLQLIWRRWQTWGTALALWTTFLICGIWHGARLNFVLWGALHGLFLTAGVFYRPWQKAIYKKMGLEKSKIAALWRTVVAFNLVCFSWTFFLARRPADAFYVCANLFRGTFAKMIIHGEDITVVGAAQYLRAVRPELIQAGILIGIILVIDVLQERVDLVAKVLGLPTWTRWGIYYCLFYSILLFSVSRETFLYFQF